MAYCCPPMAADRRELELRLAAATPADTVRGLIFNAIFSVVREAAGDEAARACDPSRKGQRTEFFNYPVTDFLRIIWDAADRLEGKVGGGDAAFYRIGHRAGELVLGSMLGKTLLALAGTGGPKQLLSHAPGGYRATVSYGERLVSWPSETHARFVFIRDFLLPAFHCGVLAVGAERAGGRSVKAVGRQTGPLEAVYDVTWQ
jgi:uncharacterized protein (TIGR02265 family)